MSLEDETKEICPLLPWCLEEFTGGRHIFNCKQAGAYEECLIYKNNYKYKDEVLK